MREPVPPKLECLEDRKLLHPGHAEPHGLRAEIFNTPDFTGPAIVRNIKKLDLDFGRGSPGKKIHPDTFSILFTGQITPDRSGKHTFTLHADDHATLWVGKKRVATTPEGKRQARGSVKLKTGRVYDIRIEYVEQKGLASAHLYWKRKGEKRRAVANGNLFAAPDKPAPSEPANTTIRLNAGGAAYTDSNRNKWDADTGFSGGTVSSNVYDVSSTFDDSLYAPRRWGDFNYALPVKNGRYVLALHFAEPVHTRAGQRRFDVSAEGNQILNDYDIVNDVGAKRAVVKRFNVNITDSRLDLTLKGVVDNAILSAIELTPGEIKPEPPPPPPPPPPPADLPTEIRINSAGNAYTDLRGIRWSADDHFTGGRTSTGAYAVADTSDDPLYYTRRFGAFSYDLPIKNGDYVLSLHFAEPVHSRAGQRKFDAIAEGDRILNDYDIFADVGAKRAVVKRFNITINDEQLDLAFANVVDNAILSAIEVTPGRLAPEPPPSNGGDTFAWQALANMPIPRVEASSAVVGGKLYVFGGFTDYNLSITRRTDVYDPATNKWTRLADAPWPHTHGATAVDGNLIYFASMIEGEDDPASAEVWTYNTKSNTWGKAPSLPEAREAGAMVKLGRELHFFGGLGPDRQTDKGTHWVLNLDNPSGWQTRSSMPQPRNHLAGAVAGGKIYAIGGQHGRNDDTGHVPDAHVYDPSTGKWTAIQDFPVSTSHINASTVVMDGRVVVVGGQVNGKNFVRDVYSYDPKTNLWLKLPSLPGGRKSAMVQVLGDSLYVVGGQASNAILTATIRGTVENKWETAVSMPVKLAEVAGGIIGNKLYLVGETHNATLSYNLTTGAWSSTSAHPIRPFVGHHHAAEVVNGKLYILGGLAGGSSGKVQIFNPANNSWSLGADMPFATGSASSALIDGEIYVAGGIIGTATTRRVAKYNPAKNTWTELAPMPHGRNHAASATDGEKLYIFGGRGPGSGDSNMVANGFDTVQIYDPAKDSWVSSASPSSGIAPLPQARGGMGKAVFVGGEFYVMGGETASGAGATSNGVYSRVDIYNPAANSWRLGTPMPTARHGIFPLLMADRIYVAGGGIRAGFSNSDILQVFNRG